MFTTLAPGVVRDKWSGEGLLVLRVRQHLQQEADQLLGKLVLDRPEDQLLHKGLVAELWRQWDAIWRIELIFYFMIQQLNWIC